MTQSSLLAFNKRPLATGIAAALLSMASTTASAANFDLGDFNINVDTTFSLGASWRVEDRKWEDTVAKSAHPRIDWNGYNIVTNPKYSDEDVWSQPGAYSANGDNGNLNFDSGETFSKLFKLTQEIDINRGNYGAFVRYMYYYDFEMMDEQRAWTNPITGQTNDPCRDGDAEDYACSDLRLLDAFIYADFDIGDMPLSIKIGDQVISWGESALISHGISEVVPVDLARLRAPGGELKEAFIPVGAIWASLGVTENFSVEAYYQYRWEESRLAPPGTYFSTNDFAGDGGYYNNIQFGFGARPDHDLEYVLNELNQLGAAVANGHIDPVTAGGIYVSRLATQVAFRGKGDAGKSEPDDGGEYGLRLSWFFPEFNETEVSLYHLNYHSRRPLFSGISSDFRSEAIAQDIAMLTQGVNIDNYHELKSFGKAFLDYPEDIKAYAMSFNTTIGTAALSGEMIYRQDEPLQADDIELLFAAMPQQLGIEGISQIVDTDGTPYGPGEVIQGYIESDTIQAQFSLANLWGPTFGAGQFTTLLEVGAVDIRDMPDKDVLRLNGPGTDRSGGMPNNQGLENAIQGGVESNPFPDAFAWGYKIVAKLDYSNAFAGINVSPRVVFSHDVNGITPDPIFLFVEDRKSVSATLNFDYQSRWSADISYNAFFDGVGTTNRMEDRDFVSFNIKYSI